MTSTWTLDRWSATERDEAWRHLISRTHLPWTLDAAAEPAAASLTERTLDGLTLVDCACGPCSGHRGRPEITRTDGEYLGVLTVLDGYEVVEQDSRRIVLGAGRSLVWSSTRPARFTVPDHLRKRTLLVPLTRLPGVRPPAAATELHGPAGRLLADHLSAVCAVGPLTGAAAAAAASAALELLAAALPAATADEPRWERVREHIEAHLADPDLRPERIAAAHAVSLRGLYQLFERRGETVSGYVRRRRLARARADLARLGPGTTVAETAHRWGFADQASFSRAFRRQYGCPPNAVRLGRG